MKAEKESMELNAVLALITRIGPCGASALGGLALLRVGKDIGEPWPHQKGLQGEALQRHALSRGACQAQDPREATRTALSHAPQVQGVASPAATTWKHTASIHEGSPYYILGTILRASQIPTPSKHSAPL